MHYKAIEGHFKQQNQQAKDIHNCAVTITFFATKEETLPHFERVGDIIRVHRANIGQYKNYKTFNANIDYGSSWVIFKGAEEKEQVDQKINEAENNIKNFFGQREEEEKQILEHKVEYNVKPYMMSGTGYSLTNVDQDKVKKLKDWSRNFFQNEIVYEGTLFMTLNKVRESIQIENANGQKPSFEREYDLVVKIEDIEE